MNRMLWTGKSAMIAQQEKLDAISNNIANVNTSGYKKVDVAFKDLLSESLDRKGYPTNDEKSFTGTGIKTTPWARDLSQGPMMETGLTSNFAIDGEGYFRVTRPDGSLAYTRNGQFVLDVNNQLVDAEGNKLELNYFNGYSQDTLKLKSDNFIVDKSGEIFVKGENGFERAAQIPLYNAVGDDAFRSIGNSLCVPTEGADLYEVQTSDIHQGYVESSNVDMSQEFTDMILAQRAFELSSKSIKTADEMWGMVNSLKGR